MGKVFNIKAKFAFPHLYEPHAAFEGNAAKYSVCILVDKNDTQSIETIKQELAVAYQEFADKNTQGVRKPLVEQALKQPFRDGDKEANTNGDPRFPGYYFMNASSQKKPKVVDAAGKNITDSSDVYSGCLGRAYINFYVFTGASKGIACGLTAVQKLADGEPFGESNFEIIIEEQVEKTLDFNGGGEVPF